MTVLESLAPAQNTFLNLMTEISGCRPNLRDLYAVGPDGIQRVLVPVGKDRYDLYIWLHVQQLTGRESDRDLQDLAAGGPRTALERGGAWMVENVTYIFTVEKFACKFMPARSRWAGAHTRVRYWFFAARLGEDQIMARIQRLVSNLLRARGLKIVDACAKKGVAPYGPLAAVIEAFARAASMLQKYADKVFERSTSGKTTRPPVSSGSAAAARDLVTTVLQVLQDRLPKLYEAFRVLVSIEYPDLCTLPGPPGL